MRRRDVFKVAIAGGAAMVMGGGKRIAFAEQFFPIEVDKALFQNINRVKDPANETPLEEKHSPVITAPDKVRAGEPFDVEIVIGKVLHPMGPLHWIEYVQLNIGNEPAGRVDFRSHGYLKPSTKFSVVLFDDLAGKKISLIVQLKCNLHGIWEAYKNVDVV